MCLTRFFFFFLLKVLGAKSAQIVKETPKHTCTVAFFWGGIMLPVDLDILGLEYKVIRYLSSYTLTDTLLNQLCGMMPRLPTVNFL